MSESPQRRLTRRSSSVVNRIETDKETIFVNSPDEQNADVVHALVPEIKIAKQVFEQPGTVEKVRQVSQQIKTADEAVITRRKSLMPVYIGGETKDAVDLPQSSQPSIETKELEQRFSPSQQPLHTESPTVNQIENVFENPKPLVLVDDTKSAAVASHLSFADTPTTILSRNVMYKESDDEESSSDSSSSESDVMSPQSSTNATKSKWELANLCSCCWLRK